MSRTFTFLLPVMMIFWPFCSAFPWEEPSHSPEEVLVHRLLLDENYVLCGTDAHWGSNTFGLFVFDRRTETWTNYPLVGGRLSASSKVKSIDKKGDHANVRFARGLIRFDLNTGEVQVGPEVTFKQQSPTTDTVKINDREYIFCSDSIVVSEGTEKRTYSPVTSTLTDPNTGKPLKHTVFCSPIAYGDRIYFGYISDFWTVGLGSFGLEDTTFHFYPSNIFKGQTTSAFIRGSSIIFATAEFRFEGNAGPAAGLVQFTPSETTFSIWRELPLPEYPIAILCLEQDTSEYWLGTDKGVFRMDKKTNVSTHYGITKGIIARDGVNVYGCLGDPGMNQYPVVAELNKGESVELLKVYHGWCEINAPVEIRGHVSISDVSEVHSEERPLTVKVEPEAVVRVNTRPDSNVLVRFNRFGNPPEDEYQVMGWSGQVGSERWYTIIMPTAWVHKDDLTFSMGEVE
jgi:hypothetical protein